MTVGGVGSMSDLPPPGEDAALQSQRVLTHVSESIAAAGGWWSFAQYHDCVLHAPGLGYYSAGASKFGAAGDFVTAPELSSLFARTCATQLDLCLRVHGGELLEIGPGTGRFAAEALEIFSLLDTPLERYALLDTSADMRARQRQLLTASPAAERIDCTWLDAWPQPFTGVVFANELLDAMPCERFLMRDGEPWRLGVGFETGRLVWRARPADGGCVGDAEFSRYLQSALDGIYLPDGYRGEFHPGFDAWFAALAAVLRRGTVLLADYGLPRRQLFHPERTMGSLRCHYRHRAHDDPFLWPGLVDVTAWVDFTAVAESATRAGFEVAGFTTQTAFLLGGGIEAQLAAAQAEARDEAESVALAHGARQLLMPGEMGEAVKFLLLTRDCDIDLPGFAFADLRHSL